MRIDEPFRAELRGLDGFGHLEVLWWPHLADADELRCPKARNGKIAIWGNHDCAGGEVRAAATSSRVSGFMLRAYL